MGDKVRIKRALIVPGQLISTVNMEDIASILCFCDIRYSVLSEEEVTFEDLKSIDCLIAIRPISIFSVEIAQTVRMLGKMYFPYYDDDLLNIGLVYRYLACHCNVKENLKTASMVIGPNPILMDEYARFSKNHRYCVLDSVCDASKMKPPKPIDKQIQIVFAGGHERDYQLLIAPILEKFLKKYGDRIEVEFIRLKPENMLLESFSNVKYTEGMPYDVYQEYMLQHSFDIGIAPLLNTSFKNRKYVSKYLEFSKYGIVGLYSNCMPYTLKVQGGGVNGVLVKNTPEAWYEALCTAVENIVSLKKIADNAYSDLLENYTVSKIAEDFLEAVGNLVEEKRYKNKIRNIKRNRRNRLHYHLAFHLEVMGYLWQKIKHFMIF